MKLHHALRLLGVAALAATASAQTTWYVDASAPPPGDGSPTHPFPDIQDANSVIETGDLILVAPGDYTDVSLGKKVVLRSTSGPLVTRIGRLFLDDGIFPDRAEGFHAKFVQMNGGVLRDCIVSPWGGGDPFIGINMYALAADFTVENCTVYGFVTGLDDRGGPFTCTSTVVRNCLFYDNGIDIRFGPDTCDEEDGISNSIVRYSFAKRLEITSGQTATGAMIEADEPGVWDALAGDYRLVPLSPCVDAGDPNSPPDPDGSRRDVGALPFDPDHAPFPLAYCEGKETSAGCTPQISSSGTPSLTGPDDFVLIVGPALNKMPGKYIWSRRGPRALPFAGGTLCVQAPIVRGPIVSSGGTGPSGSNCTGEFAWTVTQAYMQQKGWTPGETIYAQVWGRDTGYAPPDASQLSDALVFSVVP